MTVASESSVYAATLRLDIHEVARTLCAHVGPTLVAALTGAKDRRLPIRWSKANGPHPGTDFERRLRLAYRVWTVVAGSEGEGVARAWFIGGNPLLGEATPLTAIRTDHAAEVVAAADAFAADTLGA